MTENRGSNAAGESGLGAAVSGSGVVTARVLKVYVGIAVWAGRCVYSYTRTRFTSLFARALVKELDRCWRLGCTGGSGWCSTNVWREGYLGSGEGLLVNVL